MEYVKINNITTVVTGGTPSTTKKEYWEQGTIPWLQSGCCQNCDVIEAEKYITQLGYDNSSTKMMPKDTIMIALTGATAGKIGYLQFEACGNQSITGILPNEKLNQRYLYYYLISKRSKILSDCIGGAQPHISQGYVKNIEIPLYSIKEQNKIVKTLNKVKSIITHRRTQLEKLDLLVKARFVEMFGDTEVNSNDFPIKNLCDVCNVSSSKRIYREEQSNSGVPFLRISNLVELIDNDKFGSDLFIPEEKYNELLENGLVPQKGDILVTSRGTLGKCYIVRDNDRFYFQDGMISWLYDIDKSITPLYLTFLFDTRDIKRQIDNLQSGSTVSYLSITMLKKLDIVVPPIKLQQQFADFVKQVDKSKVAVQKELDKAQMLFDSLMQEYFG